MRGWFSLCLVVLLLIWNPTAQAWNGTGHMTVAYVAYQKLDQTTKGRVDALLRLNPMYSQWTSGVTSNQKGLAAFVNAATWPDCIKFANECPGYNHNDASDSGGDVPKNDPVASQNIGYKDKFMHKYWHFDDTPYSPDGLPTKNPNVPNAETQIPIFITALSASGTAVSDDIKSYDVVWLEHLIGDVHQPLHATSRFTKNFPNGDIGGNDVRFCSGQNCKENLHAYWDDLLGKHTDLPSISKLGDALLKKGTPQGVNETDITKWISASFELAKTSAYAPPISKENAPTNKVSNKPDRPYHDRALSIARDQLLMAGYRLAETLNRHLK